MSKKKVNLYKQNSLANTFIGGEGVTTTSASALETLLGLNVGDVSYFNLSGNDIEANIEVSYAIPNSCFYNNTAITYYYDNDNLITSVGSYGFYGTSSMTEVKGFESVNSSGLGTGAFRLCAATGEIYMPLYTGGTGTGEKGVFQNSGFSTINLPSLVKAWDSFCSGASNLTTFIHGGLSYINIHSFRDTPLLTSFDFSAVTDIEGYGFYNSGLTSLTAPLLTTVGISGFYNCELTSIDLPALTAIPSSCFWDNNFTTLNLDTSAPLVTTIGDSAFRRNYLMTSFTASNVTSVTGNSAFRDLTSIVTIKLPACEIIGGTTSSNSVFSSAKTGGTIDIDIVCQTSNAGGVEGDIDYLATSRSWTVNYIT